MEKFNNQIPKKRKKFIKKFNLKNILQKKVIMQSNTMVQKKIKQLILLLMHFKILQLKNNNNNKTQYNPYLV